MKVIIKHEVPKLGVPGDVKVVKNGYARNYLIPRGLAVAATRKGVEQQEQLRKQYEGKLDRLRGESATLKEKIEKMTFTVEVRTGERDKMFGSVTTADIAALLKKEGVEVDRKRIMLHEPIRVIGEHRIAVMLDGSVEAGIALNIVKQ